MQKPVFEINDWPESELEYQAAFFSIDDNQDKPTVKQTSNCVTVEESIFQLKKVLAA